MLSITPKEHQAIKKLVEYLEHDEARHYEESTPADRKGHIYESVKTLHRLAGIK